jgi:hypothetical protein
MAEWSICPSRDDLQRLILGQLVGEDAARIEQHLNGCLTCLNVLRECAASDELLEAVRARRAEGSQPTATMARPIRQNEFRGGISTWIGAQDSTFPDQNLFHASPSAVKDLLSPAQSADVIGRIADFRVLRVLCVGGMGAVFEAECPPSRNVCLVEGLNQ